jgi:hypothetical protein
MLATVSHAASPTHNDRPSFWGRRMRLLWYNLQLQRRPARCRPACAGRLPSTIPHLRPQQRAAQTGRGPGAPRPSASELAQATTRCAHAPQRAAAPRAPSLPARALPARCGGEGARPPAAAALAGMIELPRACQALAAIAHTPRPRTRRLQKTQRLHGGGRPRAQPLPCAKLAGLLAAQSDARQARTPQAGAHPKVPGVLLKPAARPVSRGNLAARRPTLPRVAPPRLHQGEPNATG